MANDSQCSWCGVVGGHDPQCYVGKAHVKEPSYDYRAAFDNVTREWARREIEHNATLGPFERDSNIVLAHINTQRHAVGLRILKYHSSIDNFTEE